MAVTAKAQAKLRFYLTMFVGSLIIAVIIGVMEAWSFTLKVLTASTLSFWGLMTVAHLSNRRSGLYDRYR